MVNIEMLKMSFPVKTEEKLSILCLGAHPDDIEIGCGGTLLRLQDEFPELHFHWVIFSGDKKRRDEALQSAKAFLRKSKTKRVDIQEFRESYFPYVGDKVKDYFEALKSQISPDIIFTHFKNDAHQDHRVISDLSWNTFRDNLILEYEIPKYDGDLGTPNLYVSLDESVVKKKLGYICSNYETQYKRQWFDAETFRAILKIRGIESNSKTKYAEAFYCRKIVF